MRLCSTEVFISLPIGAIINGNEPKVKIIQLSIRIPINEILRNVRVPILDNIYFSS